ncbi:hypothetical protein SLEP1_g20273 [Rubroshorea leprosula]|uniref:Band 7 domain-containing protein n=1 Tax=Rubroshorea leprosula TaxID=152421 RepID=A0AAV5J866_9ROSI|nr:hypothetical protein SLEP1_g20273 [Rubroshorea leprosula]
MGQALGCVQVQESNVAIVEKCGKFKDVLEPGYHCVPWCLGYNLVGKIPLGLQLLEVRCETKTEDNVFVTVFASVQYRSSVLKEKEREEDKKKAKKAFYDLPLTSAKAQIRACVLDVIRDRVTKKDLKTAFNEMEEIAGDVTKKLNQPPISDNGYEIVQTLILDIDPDVKVKAAMNDKFAADIKNKETIERADAEKTLQIKRAEGEAESKKKSGLGIAKQRKAIIDGLNESVHAFTERVSGTTGKDVMDMELATQYFDTMKEMGTSSKASHVFIMHGPDAVKDIATELRDSIIEGDTCKK